MGLILIRIGNEDLIQYKKDMQEAFQKGFEDVYGKTDDTILPEKDINNSLNNNGAIPYKAVVNGKMVGGAIVLINNDTQHNHLDFLYVKCGTQSKGVGKAIWDEIERLHPQTKLWETCTPYFDKRNIHFYVNKCGFHIVSFYNERNLLSNLPDDFIGDGGDGMFVFQKQM